EGQRRSGTQQHLASRERSLLLFLLLLLLRRVGGGLIVVHRLGRHREHRRPRCRRRSLSFHCLCCHLSSLKYCSAWSGPSSSAGTESRAIHTAQSPASAPVTCSTHHQAESRPVHATSAAATGSAASMNKRVARRCLRRRWRGMLETSSLVRVTVGTWPARTWGRCGRAAHPPETWPIRPRARGACPCDRPRPGIRSAPDPGRSFRRPRQ